MKTILLSLAGLLLALVGYLALTRYSRDIVTPWASPEGLIFRICLGVVAICAMGMGVAMVLRAFYLSIV